MAGKVDLKRVAKIIRDLQLHVVKDVDVIGGKLFATRTEPVRVGELYIARNGMIQCHKHGVLKGTDTWINLGFRRITPKMLAEFRRQEFEPRCEHCDFQLP